MCDKKRYSDKKTAVTAMNGLKKRHNLHYTNKLRVYPCPECRGWHLSKIDRGKVEVYIKGRKCEVDKENLRYR